MDRELAVLQKTSYFLGALAQGAEQNLGKGSLSFGTLAGKKFGVEAVSGVECTDDPVKAVAVLRDALARKGLDWEFEPFAGERTDLVTQEGGSRKMRLVFHGCMVRNALQSYAHEQKQLLCHMSHGVFAGAMEKVMPNVSVRLEILHAGPNGCLKEMIWEEKR